MSNFQPQLTPDNQQNPLNTQAKNTSDSFEPTKHSSKYIKKVDLAKRDISSELDAVTNLKIVQGATPLFKSSYTPKKLPAPTRKLKRKKNTSPGTSPTTLRKSKRLATTKKTSSKSKSLTTPPKQAEIVLESTEKTTPKTPYNTVNCNTPINPPQVLVEKTSTSAPNSDPPSRNMVQKDNQHRAGGLASGPTNYKPKNQQLRLLPAEKPQTNFSNVFCNNFTTKIKQDTENIRLDTPVPRTAPPEKKLKRHFIISIENHQKGYVHEFSKRLGSITKDLINNNDLTDKQAVITENDHLERIKNEVFYSYLMTNFRKHANAFPAINDIPEDTVNNIIESMAQENASFLYQKLKEEKEILTAETMTYVEDSKILNRITYGTFFRQNLEVYTESLASESPSINHSLIPTLSTHDLTEQLQLYEHKQIEDRSRILSMETQIQILTEELQRVKGYTLANAQHNEERKLKVDNITDRSWHNTGNTGKADLLYNIIKEEMGEITAEMTEIDIITPTANTKFQDTWAMLTFPNTKAKYAAEKKFKELRNNNIFKCFTRRPTPKPVQSEMKNTMDLVRTTTVELYNKAATTQGCEERRIPPDQTSKIAVKPVTRSGNYTAWFEVQCPQSNFAWIPINLDPDAKNPFDNYDFKEPIPNPTVREAAASNQAYSKPRSNNKKTPLTGANKTPVANSRNTNSSQSTSMEQQPNDSINAQAIYNGFKQEIKAALDKKTRPPPDITDRIATSILDLALRTELIENIRTGGGCALLNGTEKL